MNGGSSPEDEGFAYKDGRDLLEESNNFTGDMERGQMTMGKVRYQRSRWVADRVNLCLTCLTDSTLSKNGMGMDDKAAGGNAYIIKFDPQTTIDYTHGKKFRVKSGKNVYRFRCNSKENASLWVDNLRKIVSKIGEASAAADQMVARNGERDRAKQNYLKKNGTLGRAKKRIMRSPTQHYSPESSRKDENRNDSAPFRLSPAKSARSFLQTGEYNLYRGTTNLNRKRSKSTKDFSPTIAPPPGGRGLKHLRQTALMNSNNNGRKRRTKILSPNPAPRDADYDLKNLGKKKQIDDEELPPPPMPDDADDLPPPPLPDEDEEPPPPDPNRITSNTNVRGTAIFGMKRNTMTYNRMNRHGTALSIGAKKTYIQTDKFGHTREIVVVNDNSDVRPVEMPRKDVQAWFSKNKDFEKSAETFDFLLNVLKSKPSLQKTLLIGFDNLAISKFVEIMYFIDLKKGDEVTKQGEASSTFFIIEKGKMDSLLNPNYQQKPTTEIVMRYEGLEDSAFFTAPNRRTGRSTNASMTELDLKGIRATSSSEVQARRLNSTQKNGLREMKPLNFISDGPGGFFGMGSVLRTGEAQTTMTATVDGTRLWALDAAAYKKLVIESTERIKRKRVNCLGMITRLQELLNSEQMVALSEAMEENVYKDKEAVMTFDQPFEKVFWVLEGEILAISRAANDEPPAVFSKGDLFGEQGLVERTVCPRDFIANGDVTCLELSIEESVEIVGTFEEIVTNKMKDKQQWRKFAKQDLLNQSNFTDLNSAIDRIRLTMREQMNSRLVSQSPYHSAIGKSMISEFTMGGSETGYGQDYFHEELHLDVEKVPPLLKKLNLTNLRPLTLMGRGNFGAAHLVHYSKKDKLVIGDLAQKKLIKTRLFALKQLPRTNPDEEDWTGIINAEKGIWAELSYMTNSNFICKLLHCFATDKSVFFLTELGLDTFYKFIKKQPGKRLQDTSHQLFILGNVILGLEAIHSRSIIYRDLKPENMMLFENGYIKLIDFGLSKKCHRTTTRCGTLAFEAPEMLNGRPYGHSLDLWALGVFLFEIILGRLPFRGKNPGDDRGMYDQIIKHKTGKFVSLEKYNIEVIHDFQQFQKREQEINQMRGYKFNTDQTRATDISVQSIEEDTTKHVEDLVYVPIQAWNLINRLIEPKPSLRLGATATKYDGLKRHGFFKLEKDFNWKKLETQQAETPIIPSPLDEEAILLSCSQTSYAIDEREMLDADPNETLSVDTIVKSVPSFSLGIEDDGAMQA